MYLLMQVVWFLVPAGMANLVPPIAAKLLPRWQTPMDFGVHLRGRQLFGSHKTVRGLVTGVMLGSVIHQIQVLAALRYEWLWNLAIDPAFYQRWWLGAWLGFTALSGDAIKSLFKRQAGIDPGKPWLPWDKIDWIIGTLAGTWFLFDYPIAFVFASLMAGLVLSFAGRLVGYWLNINSSWL